jgi:chemotaxis protein CheX
MNASLAFATPSHMLILPESLDSSVAATLAETFVRCRGEDVTIDASFVRRLDENCLQVLRSAERTWIADRRMLTLVNGQAPVVEELQRFALEPAC